MSGRLVYLEEVAIIAAGGGAPQEATHFGRNGHPFVRAGSLPELVRGKKEEDLERIDTKTAAAHGLKVFPPNTVLFAKSGMSAMKGHIYVTQSPCYVVNHLAAITPKAGLNVSYLGHWFRVYPPSILVRDAAYPSIRLSEIAQLEIPLPPLAEQKRIAALLDEADTLRRKRRAALAKLDALLQSVFLEMFGDPVTNPKGWKTKPIGDCCSVETGGTPSRSNSNFYTGDIPWVKTSEVVNEIIFDTEEKITKQALAGSNCHIFPVDTILLAMYGQGLTRGRTAKLGMPATTNQACAAILPCENVKPDYLWFYLKMNYEQIRELGRGGNQPNMNLSIVRAIEFPLPPLTKQCKFIEYTRIIEDEKQKMRKMQTLECALFSSLQHQAFALSPTGTETAEKPDPPCLTLDF